MDDYTDEEKAALATGIAPAQIAARRVHYQRVRQTREAQADATLWSPINPRDIVTRPKSLPPGVRQLVSLLLVFCYPFWLACS